MRSERGPRQYNLTAITEAARDLLAQGQTPEETHRTLHDDAEFGLPHDIIERVMDSLGHRDYL